MECAEAKAGEWDVAGCDAVDRNGTEVWAVDEGVALRTRCPRGNGKGVATNAIPAVRAWLHSAATGEIEGHSTVSPANFDAFGRN